LIRVTQRLGEGDGSLDQNDYLTSDPIDEAEWQAFAVDPHDGACVEFVGRARGTEGGEPIRYLAYEAYAPMAERVIAAIVAEAQRRWSLHRVYVRHRTGRVAVGQIAVAVGVHAPHREEAFAACRFLIDAIKCEAPIWKVAVTRTGRLQPAVCNHAAPAVREENQSTSCSMSLKTANV